MQPLLAFDLDGVLYSAEPFLADAYREAIAAVNARRPGSFERVPETRQILDHVGWPVRVIIERLFPHADAAARALLFDESLRVICARVARGEGMVFPGVAPTLAQLSRQGFVLAVASNGRRQYVETVLQANGLASLFVDLVTVDDPPSHSKADILRAYLARYGCRVQDLIMVGDRSSDVEAATAVGCRFVGCDYGHGYREEVEGHGPIISNFAALAEVVHDLAGVLSK